MKSKSSPDCLTSVVSLMDALEGNSKLTMLSESTSYREVAAGAFKVIGSQHADGRHFSMVRNVAQQDPTALPRHDVVVEIEDSDKVEGEFAKIALYHQAAERANRASRMQGSVNRLTGQVTWSQISVSTSHRYSLEPRNPLMYNYAPDVAISDEMGRYTDAILAGVVDGLRAALCRTQAI